ncbi:serine/threonine-protein phosphatase 2A 56 kDa regulatory subunit gamma isoform-like [Thalassophryne amazonica]|uniref:serine/threonine-protein phosphatase 2A 56 kDa regulatory subunit gamma isoform-like n=1 Tax=Thalassophryne amazonica TaxID=390379 RepID=UPI001471B4FB|nr:serine/threonine-protein phosphatase 2A 56 kDa regulatory subunit gamma isoform-like [Thalassophryne amazonica]
MESVLAIVADVMSLRTGVKSLYTLDGQPVKSVTELKFDGCYVAVSKGKFKPVQYFSKKCDWNKCKEKQFVQAVRHKEDIKPVVQTKTEATGKNERNPKIEYFTIDVFTNGEPLIPSVPVKIPKTALKSMDNVCSVVGSMMCSHAGVKRLYTLDGQLVKDPQDLKNDGKYVAVTSGRFKPADYFQPVRVPLKKKCKNKCKETPPAVQATRHKKQVDDKIKEKKDDIWIHPPSSKLSSPHQSDVETSSPALSNKDVAESGCQEEPDIQESEQRKKNIVKQQKICPPTHSEKVIIQMLQQCYKVYDPESSIIYKERTQTLLSQIQDYIMDNEYVLSECMYPEIVNMCSSHMFRALNRPSNPPAAAFASDDEKPKLDPAWPHIELIYDFFKTFLEAPSFQAEIAKKYIGKEFVTQLLQQFASEDPRERTCLTVVFCSVYLAFEDLQEYMFHGICDIFFRITKQITPPLCEDDRIFFCGVLVPLHKPKTLWLYHQQLVECIVQFLEMDATLTEPLVLYLLKHWPKTCTCKELLFIKELAKILKCIYVSEFKLVQEPLFKQLARCISGSNHVVAKAALQFCTKEHIISFISDNAEEILPIVLPALYQCSNSQLYESVKHILTDYLPQLLMMNPELFAHCIEQILTTRRKEQLRSKASEKMWMKIEALAKSKTQLRCKTKELTATEKERRKG